MAHRLFQNYCDTLKRVTPPIRVEQKFEYLLVIDFEATCKKNEVLKPQEIIEFPCLAVSTHGWKLTDIFHEYIKPRAHPMLTPFCTELTGIIQEMVDNQPCFPDIFIKFHKWLADGGYFDRPDKSAFVTCGNWDLKIMLPNQCKLDSIELPREFKQWIDLKHIVCKTIGYYPKSLKDMLTRLNVPVRGRLHSGINDVENMVSIIRELREYSAKFEITSTSSIPTTNLGHYKESNRTK